MNLYFYAASTVKNCGIEYKTKKYHGRVILLKAQHSSKPKTINELCNGWSNFLTMPLEIRTINGSHGKLFFHRNIASWIDSLKAVLTKDKLDPILLDPELDFIQKQLLYSMVHNDAVLKRWSLDLGAKINDDIYEPLT